MDGLSAAASVIAVTSLAFQLAESTQKLFEFWNSVQHAPEEINDIKSELESLKDVLEQIGHDAQHRPASSSMVSALRLCSEKINAMKSLTADIESGFTCSSIRTRKWSAIKAVFKRERIEKVQRSLSRMKATLTLLLLNDVGQLCRVRNEHYEHDMQALTRQISDLRSHSLAGQGAGASSSSTNNQSHVLARTQEVNRVPNLVSSNVPAIRSKNGARTAFIYPSGLPSRRVIGQNDKVVETFFGTFRMSSKSSLLLSDYSEPVCSEKGDSVEYENVFRLTPPSWLARFGFTYGLSGRISQSPLSGPRLALDVVRSVPDDAVIFDLCREGNLGCVQALLSEGQASAKDVDSQGRTPLYFAAESCHVELCKLLIRYGADRDSRIYDDADLPYYNVRNPLFAIAYNRFSKTETSYIPDRVIDTLRLFIDLVDFPQLEDDIWTSPSEILRVTSKYHQPNIEEGITGDVFLWTLEILGPDFWEFIDEEDQFSSMLWCLNYGREERIQRFFELCNNVIDAQEYLDGYSLLHYLVVWGDPLPLLTMGANANLVGFDPEQSPRRETPISLSMYRADTFVKLQRALKNTTANFQTTFNQALENFPLQSSHWTKEALLELFSADLDLSPVLYGEPVVCPYCSYDGFIMAQPYWMRILKSITSRATSQSIQNIVETMLSTDSLAPAVSRDDYKREETYLHTQTQDQNNADRKMKDEDLSDESSSMQFDTEVVMEYSICDGISIDDEDMCVSCWYKWEETGLKPSLDESKCLGCGLSFEFCGGKGNSSEFYCKICTEKQQQAQRRKRRPSPTVDSDEEHNHYSPYQIHT